jgi:hypothetical protein
VLRPVARGEACGWSARTLVTIAVVAFVLGGQLRFLADVALLFGATTRGALAMAAALALPCTMRSARRWLAPLVGLALVGIAAPLITMALVSGLTPWRAWTAVAARPALAFSPAGPWTRDGGRFAVATTLTFTEEHRITAVEPATVRVTERDGTRGTVRVWRLGAGESLSLRPGDRLALDAGTRLRFETSRRVPGAAASGVAWAEPEGDGHAHGLGWLAALTLTLVGGALALGDTGTRPTRASAIGTPLVLLVLALAGVTWGLYAAYGAPDLTLGAPALAAMARLPLHVLPAPASLAMTALLVGGLVASFLAAALALAAHLAEVIGADGATPMRRMPATAYAVALALGVGAAVASSDAWSLLVSGLGLAAAALAAPALAAADGRARNVGAVVGALAFAVVAAAALLTASTSLVGAHPALLAAPLAWITARLVGTSASLAARRRATAASR